jgi:carboxyl-terminal processing protease
MSSGIKKIIISILIITTLYVGFSIGFYYGEIEGRTKIAPSNDLDMSLFWEAYNLLKEKYVDTEKFDSEQMVYGAISGMVESLDDPYTVFFDPEDAKIFEEDVSGEFQGVGMEIAIKDNQLTVVSPLDGTPAQRAGMKSGDKILKVDDISTVDITIDKAVKIIRGPEGSEVCLTVYREEWGEIKEIKIVREMIKIPSVKWELKDDNIAYIKIYHFSGTAGHDFADMASEVLDSSARKIVLDLRNNPGGYLETSQNIAGWFVEKGQIVTIEDFGDKRDTREYKAKGPAKFASYPMVVLINEGSASASEILAGALRDNRGVKLIGEKSFGKGTVQELAKLTEGSLKITVASWLTPNGDQITDNGLEPNIKVELTEEDFDQDKDPQLDKAIEILKEIE